MERGSKRSRAPALARAARSFGADTAFAVYLLTEHHLRILMTARNDQESFSVPVDGARCGGISTFLDDIAQRRDASELSKTLYEVIARRLDEFAEKHRVHRLALWLDGPLRYVPIARCATDHDICWTNMSSRFTRRPGIE